MKKVLFTLSILAAVALNAALTITPVSPTGLATDMLADSVFVQNTLMVQKNPSFADFSFGGHSFVSELVSSLNFNPGENITVDYLGRSAGDRNDLNALFGVDNFVLFNYYGVNSGVTSAQLNTTQTKPLAFWNADFSKGINGVWGDTNHFLTYKASGVGVDYYLLFVDDRGTTNLNLMDWNDGVFLATHQFSVPEPSVTVGLITMLALGFVVARRRK